MKLCQECRKSSSSSSSSNKSASMKGVTPADALALAKKQGFLKELKRAAAKRVIAGRAG